MQAVKEHVAQLKPSLGGKFLYYCLPLRKQVVLDNMNRVFGEAGWLTTAEITQLAKSFYSHVFTSIVENIGVRFLSKSKIQAKARVEGHEHLIAASRQNKGVIVVTGHFGNWELAPLAGIMQFKEFQGRLHFVRKTLGVKWLERLLFKRYYRAGLQVIPKKNSLNQVCDALERNDAVFFIMDQHASIQAKDGIMVDFFGKPAGTFRSPAIIARYTKVPIIPATSYREADGQHILRFDPPLEWEQRDDPDEEIYVNTKQINKVLENLVLEHPEQWLWMHRRWK